MTSRSKALLVAASIGTVEALKDQLGFCRWNYGIRLLHQQANNRLRSNKKIPQPARINKSEESFRKVMYLSCWGPN
ncbi:hypothetical protein F511_07443 [Dorcoceras hygrometricum]|uniref:Wound-responsive family protein n=1 Tax=Dorcoceras hygrometricum TaxID=472368 RepID=A0A2Z7ATQ5_9LAMI|nr:hypothetical protein F511_07443 [Dorcoceras hygrometricum]